MMASDTYRRMKIKGQRESKEDAAHRRLRRRLEGWADSLGFGQRDEGRVWAVRPDVVRADDTGRYLFFGDAAMADHERPNAPGVRARIATCATEFAALIRTEEIQGGRIAVATDCEKMAAKWAKRLARAFGSEGITDETGSKPSFVIKRLAPKTWVAYW